MKPKHPAKPSVWVFVGDLHCKPTGLWAEDNLSARNKRQLWLMQSWRSAVKEIVALGKAHTMILALGGDMVDLPGKAARDAALGLLQPIARAGVAAEVWGVVGTPYHVGPDGSEDRQIYQELGAAKHTSHMHRLIVDGRRLWWSHHGAALGVDAATGLHNTAKKIWTACREHEWNAPSLVVTHHVHHAIRDYGYYRGVKVAVTPCWQLPDDYTAKRITWSAPTIGYLVWWPATDALQWRTFPIPESLLYG